MHKKQDCFPNKRSQGLAILQYLQELDNESRTVVAFAIPQIYRTVIHRQVRTHGRRTVVTSR